MRSIKSLADLQEARTAALKKSGLKTTPDSVHILIALDSSSIAMGAQATLQEIQNYIENRKLSQVSVHKRGLFGPDSCQPVIQVIGPGDRKIKYGRVTPPIARRIMQEHIEGGQIVEDFLLED